MQELNKSRSTKPSAVKAALLTLPKTLDETYERMLGRIDTEDRTEALTLLRWLKYSYAPLTLERLTEACVVDPKDDPASDGIVDIENKASWRDTLDILAGSVVAIMPGQQDHEGAAHQEGNKEASTLLPDPIIHGEPTEMQSAKHIRKNTFVRLAYFSVKEYLQSLRIQDTTVGAFHFDPGREHRSLAQSCLVYLAYHNNSPQNLSSQQDLISFPLLLYTAKYCWTHVKEQRSRSVDRELRSLCNDKDLNDSLSVFSPLRSERPFGRPQNCKSVSFALPFASHCGLKEVVDGLLLAGYVIDGVDGEAEFALCAAAREGQEVVVQLLLDAKADVQVEDNHGDTALYGAARHGHAVVVQLLLDANADVNSSRASFGAALQVAVANGDEAIVQMLLGAKADVDLQGEHMVGRYRRLQRKATTPWYKDFSTRKRT
jgi:hypothetical protein